MNYGIYSQQNELHQLCYVLKGKVENLEKVHDDNGKGDFSAKAGVEQFGLVKFASNGDIADVDPESNTGVGVVRPFAITNTKLANMSDVQQLKGSSSSNKTTTDISLAPNLVIEENAEQVYISSNYGVLYQNSQKSTVSIIDGHLVVLDGGISYSREIEIYTSSTHNNAIDIKEPGIYKISFGCKIISPARAVLSLNKGTGSNHIASIACSNGVDYSLELIDEVPTIGANSNYRLLFNTPATYNRAFLWVQRID